MSNQEQHDTDVDLALAELELARRAALEIMRDCPQTVLSEMADAFDAAEDYLNSVKGDQQQTT